MAAQQLGAVVADAVVADDHAAGRASDEEIHAGERGVQEEARRGRRPHVVPGGERVEHPAGLAREERRAGGVARVVRRVPGRDQRADPGLVEPLGGDEAPGRDGEKRPVPVRDRPQHLARAFPELDRVHQVRDALVVADDARLGEARGDVAGRPRVVEVDVGDQDEVQPRHAERIEAAPRAGRRSTPGRRRPGRSPGRS